MKLSRLLLPATLAFSLLAGHVAAFEWETLYSRGSWRLDLNFHDDGTLSCESRTVNSSGYVMSLYTWDDGDYVIRFQNDSWAFGDTSQSQDFVVRIDRRSPWNITGTKSGNIIQIIITPPSDSLSRFFREVARGSTLYLGNDRGSEITRFSLRGTTATLNQHRTCERRIFSGGGFRRSDPFQ